MSNFAGIDLSSSSNNSLSSNDCSSSNLGISLGSSSNNTLRNNNCSSNSFSGMWIYSSSSNTLSNNTCSNSYHGIFLGSSSNNTLSNNTCSLNIWDGMHLGLSSNNTLSNNDCSYNVIGMYLFSSSNDNILSNNTASSNGARGVWLADSTGIAVYHNIFIDNTDNHACDNRGSENLWNASYPTGGNYWDDYTGVDEFSGLDQDQPGPDGIGDTPYVIDANSTDYYPLMESLPNTPPAASFTVSPSTGYVSTVFSVDASSCSDAEDDLSELEVRWNWESDGTWDTSWSVEKTDSHQYSAEGTYTITLEVKDTEGLIDNTTKQVTVATDNAPPVADAGTNQTVTVGEEVTFDGSESSDDVGIENHTWTFTYDEAGRELHGVAPAFTFDISGTYIVTLSVEDAEGETDTDTVTIVVEEEEQEDEDEKSFIESYGLPLGIAVALAIVALILFFVLKGRKGGEAPVTLVEPRETEPVD
ncbi:MAG: right-handed parallel beta-helix repeat-containing protein [Methanobacteriota archaeon]|nr:MAG: right-handed parallel beta-helix repeat-containing protein [Euryarchaeota archaeon]